MKKRRPTEKKLICCVNPGLSDTRTTVEDARRLSKLDFPTLERPVNDDTMSLKIGLSSKHWDTCLPQQPRVNLQVETMQAFWHRQRTMLKETINTS